MIRKSTLIFFLSTPINLVLIFVQLFLIHHFAVAQQSQTAEIDLADALVAAKTQEERNYLLESKKQFVTPAFVKSLIEKGNRFRLWGEYPEAERSFEQAKYVAEYLKDRSAVAEALNGIGVIQYMRSEFTLALKTFDKSLNLSKEIGNQIGIAQSLNHIGRVHYMQYELDVAYEYYQKSLSIRQGLNDRPGIAESLSSIGMIHYMRTEYSKALECLRQSLAIREELKDDEGIASALANIGLVELESRNIESAEVYFKKSLLLREKLGDKAGIVTIQSALGSLQYHQSNYEEALQHYQSGLNMAKELGNKMQTAWIQGAVGQVYYALGHYRLALDSYQKSLELREQIGDKSGAANALNLIGQLHLNQGNYKLALEYHDKSLHLSEALQDKKEKVNALLLMGNAFNMGGDHEKALEFFQKSLVLTEETQDKILMCILLNDIADAQSKLGNSELAMKNLEQSLEVSKEIHFKDETVHSLNSISEIQYKRGNYVAALDFADRAVNLARDSGRRTRLWPSLMNQSKAYYSMSRPDKAIHSLEEAIHTIETLRIDVAGGEQEEQRFFEDKVVPYNMMVDFLVQKKGTEAEALTYAERAKARALLDVLQSGRTTITGTMTPEELNQERILNRKLISLNQQLHQAKFSTPVNEKGLTELTANLEKARLTMEGFRANIYATHPELKIQRGEVEIVTPEKLNELLPDSLGAFLEYVVTPEKTLLFVITKSANQAEVSTKVYTINLKQSDLAPRISTFRKQLASRSLHFRKEAAALHNLLIAPAVAILKTKRSLVIVPDDVLWELPFQALLSSENRYLLEDYSLFYVPSLTVFSEMKKLQKKKPELSTIKLFAMGNPTLGSETKEHVQQLNQDANLNSLLESEKEVLELAKLYGEKQSTIYLGPDAREDRLKKEAGRYNLVHLATHGFLNDATPMYSQILLASNRTQEEDGLLEAREILNLKLNANLVVLSACETALGRVGKGEGMIGLAWALFVSGVPTTVVSQWRVDSASTTELMIQFHKRLRSMRSDASSSSPVPDALREAALNLLHTDEYRHPFYWAPFVVIGSGF